MEKQEILNHLLEKALEITAYLEEHCDIILAADAVQQLAQI